jgi:hypothetical protein
VYKAYQSVKTTNEYQLNWYSQLEALCVKWNCSSVLNLGLEQDQYKISLNRALNLVNKHFKKVEDESISLDICKLRNTTFFSLYANNKTHCTQQAYLNDNNPMNVKKLILQLKLGVSHITHKGKVARLKHLEKFYNKTDSDKCDLCGREQEDTYHLLFVCPHFRSDRIKYIYEMSKFDKLLNRENYLVLFNELDETDGLKLYHFFTRALSRRKYYLEEMNDS